MGPEMLLHFYTRVPLRTRNRSIAGRTDGWAGTVGFDRDLQLSTQFIAAIFKRAIARVIYTFGPADAPDIVPDRPVGHAQIVILESDRVEYLN